MSWIIEGVNGWVRINIYHPTLSQAGLWVEVTEDLETYKLWKKGDYYELRREQIDHVIEKLHRSFSIWF